MDLNGSETPSTPFSSSTWLYGNVTLYVNLSSNADTALSANMSDDSEDNHVQILSSQDYIIILNALLAFSLLGNALLFVLSWHASLRTYSYGVYLRVLATTDSLVFIIICTEDDMIYSKGFWEFIWLSESFCLFWTYIRTSLIMLSPWLVVLLTLDRYIAVVFPLKRPRFCTPRTAIIASSGAILCVLIYRLPVATFQVEQMDELDKTIGFCEIVNEEGSGIEVYEEVSKILFFPLLPCLVILCLNLHVLLTMYKRAVERRRGLQEGQGGSSSGSVINRKTFSLLMVSVMAFLTLLPVTILDMFEMAWLREFEEHAEQLEPGETLKWPYKLTLASELWRVFQLFSLSNHGDNFYVLMATNPRFRKTMGSMLMFWKKQNTPA